MGSKLVPHTKFDILWIDTAERFSRESKDRSTKVGAVIVKDNILISQGWNGFARGIDDNVDDRHETTNKHDWVIHAEINALLNHCRNGGSSLIGSTLYMNYRPGICSRCLSACIQAGIKRIVGPKNEFPGKCTGYSVNVSQVMAQEAGIAIHYIDYDKYAISQ